MLRPGCACTSVKPEQFTLPPDGTRNVSLKINLAAAWRGDSMSGPFSTTIRAVTAPSGTGFQPVNGKQPDAVAQEWTVHGEFTIRPEPRHLGLLTVGRPHFQEYSIAIASGTKTVRIELSTEEKVNARLYPDKLAKESVHGRQMVGESFLTLEFENSICLDGSGSRYRGLCD